MVPVSVSFGNTCHIMVARQCLLVQISMATPNIYQLGGGSIRAGDNPHTHGPTRSWHSHVYIWKLKQREQPLRKLFEEVARTSFTFFSRTTNKLAHHACCYPLLCVVSVWHHPEWMCSREWYHGLWPVLVPGPLLPDLSRLSLRPLSELHYIPRRR